MFCENRYGAALRPGCHGKEATKEMFISYGTGETDTLHVCAECCERIHKSATKHGYLVSWHDIGKGAKKIHKSFDKSLFTGRTRT
jgi:hypothetical protein